jgi:hypothetical protein
MISVAAIGRVRGHPPLAERLRLAADMANSASRP